MRRLALYFASACLVLSLLVNAASYFGISLFENFAPSEGSSRPH